MKGWGGGQKCAAGQKHRQQVGDIMPDILHCIGVSISADLLCVYICS
jgi:hypothetical protein